MVLAMHFSVTAQAQEAEGPTSLKSVKVYENGRASGWYLNGWSGGKMVEKSSDGMESSKCLAVTGTPGQGGAGFRTKREGAEFEMPANEDGTWNLVFFMKPASDVKLRAFSLDDSVKSKEITITKYKSGEAKDGWQKYSIPLKDTAAGMTLFAGIAVRIPKQMPDPILMDDLSLELIAK
jgi:hypothetical protein